MDFEERNCVVLSDRGEKIFATYHRPLVETGKAVMMCHGFGGHRSGKCRIYVLMSELLSKMGIASLRFDCRGCGESEGDLVNTTISSMVEDSLLARDFLKKNHDSLGIIGRSLGGAVATLVAESSPEIKSMAFWSPLFNGEQWSELFIKAATVDLSLEQQREIMAINGQLGGKAFFDELFALSLPSPLESLGSIPMLFIHSVKDPLVHILHTDNYLHFRKGVPGKTECIRLQHSNHDFSHFDEREAALSDTANWFVETL